MIDHIADILSILGSIIGIIGLIRIPESIKEKIQKIENNNNSIDEIQKILTYTWLYEFTINLRYLIPIYSIEYYLIFINEISVLGIILEILVATVISAIASFTTFIKKESRIIYDLEQKEN